jgi:hypothetical protein
VTRLQLRRGRVTSVEVGGPAARVTVDVGGTPRPALALTDLTGPVEPGDDVVVNVAALDLGLGSGGFDVLHVNLTRGLDAGPAPGHVMKLNYTSLQHAVAPLEEGGAADEAVAAPLTALRRPVAVLALHGQLAPVAWAAAERAAGARVGYVQAPGGALPGALSDTVRELRRRTLLAAHVTAGPCVGGEHEAVTVAGAIHAGFTLLAWDAAVVGPGPGIVGSASALGHGGLAALDAAHAALALGCPAVIVPRMSSGDPRARHRGLSHHTAAVLGLLLRPALVALPPGEPAAVPGEHLRREGAADLDGYRASGLPARTMGRDIGGDPLFFRAALAGGTVLGEEIHGV